MTESCCSAASKVKVGIMRIEEQQNRFNSFGDVRTEYVVLDALDNNRAAFETLREAESAIIMLTGGPGSMSFYDYHAQVWYPKH